MLSSTPHTQGRCLLAGSLKHVWPVQVMGSTADPRSIDADFINSLDWSDVWEDAGLADVLSYLKTSKYLVVPPNLAEHIPWSVVGQ